MLPPMQTQAVGNDTPESAEQVFRQLGEILADPVFATSKRCQDFLRYIVQETVEGRGGDINERSIAYEVFGKSVRFEPSEDSLVRVKAHEVRRRLTQFYEAHPESSIRIKLSLGGYTPHFEIHKTPSLPPPIPEAPAKALQTAPLSRRRMLWALGGLMAGAAVAVPVFHLVESPAYSPLDLLWKPVFATRTPLLIFIPLLKSSQGEITDRIGLGTAATVSRAADFMTLHRQPYHLRFGPGLTFEQLREQPCLLLGGFSSTWALWATKNLRYSLAYDDNWEKEYVEDRQSREVWRPVNLRPNGYADQDYGIVCRLFDALTGQVLFVAAGITTFGTEGAASVLFDQTAFSSLLRNAPGNWTTKNFEAVIRVSIIGTTPSPAELVACHFW